MSFLRREPAKPLGINLGRTHEVLAEVHHAGGEDDWWYHGYLWLTETRSVRRRDFDPALTDPRNQRVLWQIRHGWTDDQIADVIVNEASGRALVSKEPLSGTDRAAARDSALSIARSVRLASESANEEHSLRLYGLGTASKTEERILVTIDQDLLAEATQIPYPQTERGARRRQLVIGAFGAILYGLLLGWTFWTLWTSSAAIGGLPALEAQMALPTLVLAPFAAVLFAVIGVYLVMARRIRVLDIQVQPVWSTKVHEHTEAVFLVNSKKRPASQYLLHLFGLPREAVLDLAREFSTFQTDLISSLQGQATSYRNELDNAAAQLEAERQRQFDRELLTRSRPLAGGGWNWPAIVLLVAVVSVLVGVAVYVVIAAGG
jgi:hypothetical protein